MQLSLTQSDISHIGSMRVEGIVHPTTAEIDLKEDIGKVPSALQYSPLFGQALLRLALVRWLSPAWGAYLYM